MATLVSLNLSSTKVLVRQSDTSSKKSHPIKIPLLLNQRCPAKLGLGRMLSVRPIHAAPESVSVKVEESIKSVEKVIEQNPLTLSDEQILDLIYTTHVHSDTKFDVGSLFIIVENILNRSTHIVDKVIQGSRGNPEQIDDNKFPQSSFSSPLCTLKQISSEMSCKLPADEIAHETTLAILHKLSSYNWDAKAVLTLASFALEYGDFWLLYQLQPTDPLAKSVAILKRVPLLTKPQAVTKHRNAIVEVNNMIKATWQVIELIFELENLSSHDTKDVPALAPALEQIPVDVYWAIISVVAITTQIDCLTTDSKHTQELYYYSQKINIILSKLRKQVSLCRLQIEEAEYIKRLRKIFQTPTEIMEVFKVLLFWKDAPQNPIYDGATKTLVSFDALKKKNVLLFISTLDITEEEISILKPIYELIKTGNQYKIVWIPIVEEWNEQLKKKFEIVKSKMPWLVVQHFGSIQGYKYIKEEWQFKKKPMVVVLNPQGKVQHPNAFHMIQVWGEKAFPFTLATEETLTQAPSWIGPFADNIHPNITPWIKEEKYIFFYGGKDKEWIQQFTKFAEVLVNDAVIKQAKISIELFCVEKEHKSIIGRFWSAIESLFVIRMNRATNPVTREVQRLLSYKNETGWALLSKGSTVVLTGHGTSILKTVAEFEKWKEVVSKKGFETSFKEYHEKVAKTNHRCSHLEVPIVAGKIPETIECPECQRPMEAFISYKCCHDEETSAIA